MRKACSELFAKGLLDYKFIYIYLYYLFLIFNTCYLAQKHGKSPFGALRGAGTLIFFLYL